MIIACVFQMGENDLLTIVCMLFIFYFVHKERTLNQNAISQFPTIKIKNASFSFKRCLSNAGSCLKGFWHQSHQTLSIKLLHLYGCNFFGQRNIFMGNTFKQPI